MTLARSKLTSPVIAIIMVDEHGRLEFEGLQWAWASRGAHTARVLAAMIHKVGLL